jgi:hypothetical protein
MVDGARGYAHQHRQGQNGKERREVKHRLVAELRAHDGRHASDAKIASFVERGIPAEASG